MIAIQFGCEVTIRFERPGKRLFEQNAMARCNQRGGVFAVIPSRGYDDSSLADLGGGQLLDRRKYRNVEHVLSCEAARAFDVGVYQRSNRAGSYVGGEFTRMQRMDRAHASNTGYGEFQRQRTSVLRTVIGLPRLVTLGRAPLR